MKLKLIIRKAKPTEQKKKSWLRIYAIRISANVFVVSGSAIKLTASMHEREHTFNELKKLDKTLEFLKQNNLIDEDDFGYLEMEF